MKRFLTPYTFTVLTLLVLIGIDIYFLKDEFAFFAVNPHPFLILSVVIASLYGLRPALFAAAISSATYLIDVHLNLNYMEVETLLDFKYLSTPILLTVTSVIVGEVKQRSLDKISRLNSDIDNLRKGETLHIARETGQEKEITELKKRLVSRLQTTSSFYEIATSFHALDEKILLENFSSALVQLFKGAEVDLMRLPAKNEKALDFLTRESLRTGKIMTIKEGTLVRNFDSNADRVLLSLPLIVNGKIEFIARVSKIPFLEYIPSQFRIAEIYAAWVGSSLAFERTFRSSEDKKIWNELLQVYHWTYFRDRLDEEFARSLAYMLPLSVMKIRIENFPGLSSQKATLVRKLVSGLATQAIRKLDYIAEGEFPDEFVVLFPIADEALSRKVMEKIDYDFTEFRLRNTEQNITLSFHTSAFTPDMESSADLLKGLN